MFRAIGIVCLFITLTACSVTVNEQTEITSATSPSTVSVERTTEIISTADSNSAATPEIAAATSITGRLFFADDTRGILEYNLESEELRTIYQPLDHAITRSISVSPDGESIVVAYAPPPPEDNALQFGFTQLYILPADGSAAPTPLLEGGSDTEIFFLPSWSLTGNYLYYSHIAPNPDDATKSRIQMERIAYPDKTPEILAINAFSPRLTPDESKIVYVARDPDTLHDELMVANPDGTEPTVVLENNLFIAIDAPVYSPDGEYILFSAVTSDQIGSTIKSPALSTMIGWLTGAQVVRAHSVPSDIWRVPANGGRATQITFLYAVNLWPDFSPDGQKMALLSLNRVYIMNPDGTDVVTVLTEGASGTLDWIT